MQEAIEHSGLLKQFSEINLETQKVGVFSKITKLNTKLEDGSWVEIYRSITADPETVERRDM